MENHTMLKSEALWQNAKSQVRECIGEGNKDPLREIAKKLEGQVEALNRLHQLGDNLDVGSTNNHPSETDDPEVIPVANPGFDILLRDMARDTILSIIHEHDSLEANVASSSKSGESIGHGNGTGQTEANTHDVSICTTSGMGKDGTDDETTKSTSTELVSRELSDLFKKLLNLTSRPGSNPGPSDSSTGSPDGSDHSSAGSSILAMPNDEMDESSDRYVPSEQGNHGGGAGIEVPTMYYLDISGRPVFIDGMLERRTRKFKLALAFRLMAKNGVRDGLCGYITTVDPIDTTTFWINPVGISWSKMKVSDLMRIGEFGEVIEGKNTAVLNVPGLLVHLAIKHSRPDVECVIHGHIPSGTAFSAQENCLQIKTQDACVFYDDISYNPSYTGIVGDYQQADHIAEVLADNKATVLKHHGLLTVGSSIESAVHWFIALEHCCQAQLGAGCSATGTSMTGPNWGSYNNPNGISTMMAVSAYSELGTEPAGYYMGHIALNAMKDETDAGSLDED